MRLPSTVANSGPVEEEEEGHGRGLLPRAPPCGLLIKKRNGGAQEWWCHACILSSGVGGLASDSPFGLIIFSFAYFSCGLISTVFRLGSLRGILSEVSAF